MFLRSDPKQPRWLYLLTLISIPPSLLFLSSSLSVCVSILSAACAGCWELRKLYSSSSSRERESEREDTHECTTPTRDCSAQQKIHQHRRKKKKKHVRGWAKERDEDTHRERTERRGQHKHYRFITRRGGGDGGKEVMGKRNKGAKWEIEIPQMYIFTPQ